MAEHFGNSEENSIIAKLAGGATQASIAKEFDRDPSTISRLASRNRELIEEQAQKYIDELSNIVARDISEIKDAEEISKIYRANLKAGVKDDMDFSRKEYLNYVKDIVKDVKKGIGLIPSHAPAPVYQSLHVNVSGDALSPLLLSMLGIGDNKTEERVIDVDID